MPTPPTIPQIADSEAWPVDRLAPYPGNPREHPPEQVDRLAESIRRFGFTVPIVAAPDGEVLAGHGRLLAARQMGLREVPVRVADHLSEAERRAYRLADNRIAEMGVWDTANLEAELAGLDADDYPLRAIGFDAKTILELSTPAETAPTDPTRGRLVEDFLEPPISVLNTVTGRWQARKRAWLEVIPFEAEALGRDAGLILNGPERGNPAFYAHRRALENKLGREIDPVEYKERYYEHPGERITVGTSSFDPVLAELMTIWFSPPGGLVVDPFAGGVERGIVVATKGREYHGIDIRGEQVRANTEIAAKVAGLSPPPRWTQGDATEADAVWSPESADFALACPPYWCLEKYSDDPADLSNMTLADFDAAHAEIVRQTADALKPNRFAAWVVGECRDPKTGVPARLVDRTADAFERAGMWMHSEFVLVTSMGSRPIAARKAFESKRTVMRRHEIVSIFVKGDPAVAAAEIGPIEVGEMPGLDTDGE